ncbi:glycoside hydrolase family 26 protein [Blastococcus mobilis]|uniref:glycoside hydrolase family 26 protein n=1 Tax=Blastococcus mobilis TaxID=1938746 RepID=UPI000B781D70|nr:glycosyl hydrolase [Blastococcus mobilis]
MRALSGRRRPSVPAAPLAPAAVIAAVLLLLPGSAPDVAPAPLPTFGWSRYFGVTLPRVPADLGDLERFEQSVGRRADLVMWYAAFDSFPDFPSRDAAALLARGSIPEISWEPWVGTGGVEQPAYRLSTIINGGHDEYIRRWARQIRDWGGPLWLRFGYEMNGNWNSWSEGVNGNRPGEYVQAWRHVHRLFEREGARNVVWVWSPNVDSPTGVSLRDVYPGDDVVDVAALDGYNWGRTQQWSRWRTFEQVFATALDELDSLTSRPLVLGEVGSTEMGGDKAAWVKNFFAALDRRGGIRGFLWFNYDKETDWRVQSSPDSLAAFRAGLSQYGR